jgi:membrane protein implicated in regulation of membrane protease activity
MPVAIVWLAVALVFAVVEVATTALLGGFITLGALAAAVAAFVGGDILTQAIVFAVVSMLGLVIARRPLMAYLRARHGPQTLSGAYAMIGQRAVVVDPITGEHDRGHVRIAGEDWPALSRDGLPVESGAVVRVAEINKATLLVDRIPVTPGHSADGFPPGPPHG